MAQKIGKACAPIAAAILLMAQTSPALAETQFEASIRRQQEFLSGGKSGGLSSFFSKGKDAASEGAESAKEAASEAAPSLSLSNPVETAKDAAKDVSAAAPSTGGNPFAGLLGGSKPEEAVKDAASSAQSAAKAAAPDDVSSAGKEAASTVADSAKDLAKFSQKEAEVVGTGDSTPTGGGLTSKAVDSAKSAASDVKDAAPDVGGGNPVDAAKSAASNVKDAAPSVGGSNPVEAAKSAASDVKDAAPGGGPFDFLKNATPEAGGSKPVDAVKDLAPKPDSGNPVESNTPATNPVDAAVNATTKAIGPSETDAGPVKGGDSLETGKSVIGEAPGQEEGPTKNFLSSLLGGESKKGPGEEAPQPSQLEEKVPKGAEPLPEQPYPEPETKKLGDDNAGGKVQETARGSGILDLFGGGKSGKSPSSKADDLVEEAKKPNPTSSFLGNLFGIEEPKEAPKTPDFGLKGGTSSLPSSNSIGDIADGPQLAPPQPSEVDEAGSLPESAPGTENKLPEQPQPEPTPPEQLGKDSAGGKTSSTKSGGGVLDFFGGSSSQSSQPASDIKPVSYSFTDQPLTFVKEQLAAPQPSSLEEEFPESAPGNELKPEEQPYPEPASKDLPQDSAGGKTSDSKRGSGPLDFFGGADSGSAAKTAEKNIEKAESTTPSTTPETTQIVDKSFNQSQEVVGLVAEAEEGPDSGKATLIGVGFTILLEILIFTLQPTAKPKHH